MAPPAAVARRREEEVVWRSLKNSVMTKERSQLGTAKAEMPLRVGLNPRFLREAKEKIRAGTCYRAKKEITTHHREF